MAGKTQIGNRAITKKMFGTREITKEVVNGVVVYEKSSPPQNITFTVTNTAGQIYQAQAGMTWRQFINSDYNPWYYFGLVGHEVTFGSGTLYYVGLVECGYSQLLDEEIINGQTYIGYNPNECGN